MRGNHHAISAVPVDPAVLDSRQVSDLWSLRDFWEWLAPGYSCANSREYALSNAAFTSFVGLAKFRDFKMELEASSTPDDPKVGLWAKASIKGTPETIGCYVCTCEGPLVCVMCSLIHAVHAVHVLVYVRHAWFDGVPLCKQAYMTTDQYTFLGTLLTRKSVETVTRGGTPKVQSRAVSEQKTVREAKVIEKLTAAMKGQYRQQFSAARLSDALAMCKRDWAYFECRGGNLGPHSRLLPAELAARMRADGRPIEVEAAMQAEQVEASAFLDPAVNAVPAVQRRAHMGQDIFGFVPGPQVPLKKAVAGRALTFEAFSKRPVTPGSFVITRPAPHGPWAKSKPELAELDLWMWSIREVIPPNAPVPGFKKPAASFVYEAHLYHPVRTDGIKGKWVPLFVDDRPIFMRTEKEKNEKHQKRSRHHSPCRPRSPRRPSHRLWGVKRKIRKVPPTGKPIDQPRAECLRPVRCYLRPENIIGGGFARTANGAIPDFVVRYGVSQRATA